MEKKSRSYDVAYCFGEWLEVPSSGRTSRCGHIANASRVLTLAFSKKLTNFKTAIALKIAYYNLVKPHGTLRCTPAMAAGVESSA